jgi:hypothetical protein
MADDGAARKHQPREWNIVEGSKYRVHQRHVLSGTREETRVNMACQPGTPIRVEGTNVAVQLQVRATFAG